MVLHEGDRAIISICWITVARIYSPAPFPPTADSLAPCRSKSALLVSESDFLTERSSTQAEKNSQWQTLFRVAVNQPGKTCFHVLGCDRGYLVQKVRAFEEWLNLAEQRVKIAIIKAEQTFALSKNRVADYVLINTELNLRGPQQSGIWKQGNCRGNQELYGNIESIRCGNQKYVREVRRFGEGVGVLSLI